MNTRPRPATGRRLDEALQIIRAMWTEPYASFQGSYYQVSGGINEPKGVQRPHPPIWIGGSGEKVTLKLAARYGDATNLGGHLNDMSYYTHKYDVIRAHCEAIGRDPDTLIRSANVETTLLRPGDDPEQLTRRYRRDDTRGVPHPRRRGRSAGGHRHLRQAHRRRGRLHHRLGPAWPRHHRDPGVPSCRGPAGFPLRFGAGSTPAIETRAEPPRSRRPSARSGSSSCCFLASRRRWPGSMSQ